MRSRRCAGPKKLPPKSTQNDLALFGQNPVKIAKFFGEKCQNRNILTYGCGMPCNFGRMRKFLRHLKRIIPVYRPKPPPAQLNHRRMLDISSSLGSNPPIPIAPHLGAPSHSPAPGEPQGGGLATWTRCEHALKCALNFSAKMLKMP